MKKRRISDTANLVAPKKTTKQKKNKHTQARILPLYRVITVVICVCNTLVSCVLSRMLLTHDGSCECQHSVCPRIVLLFCTAQLTSASACAKLKLPWLDSVASHFIEFSGVTCPKSCWITAADLPVDSRFWSVAVPKYNLPLAVFVVASRYPVVEMDIG